MVWGAGATNISRTRAAVVGGDAEYLEDIFPDTQFGGGQEGGGEMTVIGEEEDTFKDTSQPFPLPPDVFAEVSIIASQHHSIIAS